MAVADWIFGRSERESKNLESRGLLTRRQRSAKRLFDVTVASVTLIAISPVIAATAALVKISSPGPAFYRHRRVGRNGVMFEVLKFRTMYASESGTEWGITVGGDPRVTPLGRWLRKTKLDEVPQLWNVLRGEMSLVGWRPHVAGYPDRLTGPDAILIAERPGITGAASLFFRDEERTLAQQPDPRHHYDHVVYPSKVKMDLEFYRSWALSRDVACLIVTALPFADRWLQVVPSTTLIVTGTEGVSPVDERAPEQLPNEQLNGDRQRPVAAIPVRPNGTSAAAERASANGTGSGNGHRNAVVVPVRPNRDEGDWIEPIVIGSPPAARAAGPDRDPHTGDVGERVRSR